MWDIFIGDVAYENYDWKLLLHNNSVMLKTKYENKHCFC